MPVSGCAPGLKNIRLQSAGRSEVPEALAFSLLSLPVVIF